MINLKRYNNALVTPKDDALLYDFIINGSGVFEGLTVVHLGANQLLVSAGRGIIMGRDFTAAEETILAQLSPSGTQQGRLIIRIDMANTESPVEFATQVAPTLPPLVQEDINRGGTIYELPIATYDADELQINNLVYVASKIEGINAKTADHAIAADNGTYTLTHTAPGGVHTLAGLPTAPGLYSCQFIASAPFNEGNTFAGGYTAKPMGEETALPDKAFVAGDLVTLVADTGAKKLGFKLGGGGGKLDNIVTGLSTPPVKQKGLWVKISEPLNNCTVICDTVQPTTPVDKTIYIQMVSATDFPIVKPYGKSDITFRVSGCKYYTTADGWQNIDSYFENGGAWSFLSKGIYGVFLSNENGVQKVSSVSGAVQWTRPYSEDRVPLACSLDFIDKILYVLVGVRVDTSWARMSVEKLDSETGEFLGYVVEDYAQGLSYGNENSFYEMVLTRDRQFLVATVFYNYGATYNHIIPIDGAPIYSPAHGAANLAAMRDGTVWGQQSASADVRIRQIYPSASVGAVIGASYSGPTNQMFYDFTFAQGMSYYNSSGTTVILYGSSLLTAGSKTVYGTNAAVRQSLGFCKDLEGNLLIANAYYTTTIGPYTNIKISKIPKSAIPSASWLTTIEEYTLTPQGMAQKISMLPSGDLIMVCNGDARRSINKMDGVYFVNKNNPSSQTYLGNTRTWGFGPTNSTNYYPRNCFLAVEPGSIETFPELYGLE